MTSSRRIAIVRTWAERWRSLAAWRRDLVEVAIDVVAHRRGPLGTARPGLRVVSIRVGSDVVDGLATALHELAHVAVAGDAAHGDAWKERYLLAVEEVTGRALAAPPTIELLDRSVVAALRGWWRASGNEFLATLLG
jgi:hypothetical protein